MNYRILWLTFIICAICTNIYAQILFNPEIRLGLSADSVETLVANEVQGHHDAGGYLVKMSAHSITYKGQLKEVILQKENVQMDFFQKGAKFSVHFLIERNVLYSIRVEHENLTLDEAKALIKSGRINMSDYYFDTGYYYYHHVYQGTNKLVIDEYKPTVFMQLPTNVQEQLKMISGRP